MWMMRQRSCSARLCFTCQAMTGGVSVAVRVRNTAVPGVRGIARLLSRSTNWSIGTTLSRIRAAIAIAPRCQISMMP